MRTIVSLRMLTPFSRKCCMIWCSGLQFGRRGIIGSIGGQMPPRPQALVITVVSLEMIILNGTAGKRCNQLMQGMMGRIVT